MRLRILSQFLYHTPKSVKQKKRPGKMLRRSLEAHLDEEKNKKCEANNLQELIPVVS